MNILLQQELNEKAEAIQAVWVGHDVCKHVVISMSCDVHVTASYM